MSVFALSVTRCRALSLTREFLRRRANVYIAIPLQINDWITPNVTLLRKFQIWSKGVAGASVLLEAPMDFPKYRPSMRGNLLYENGEEYEHGPVTYAALKLRDVKKAIGIA